MSSKRGADLLVEGLTGAGVNRIFTLSGNQIMPIFDACIDAEISLLHVRHEAAAVHMADAWGRLTGEAGIAMVLTGATVFIVGGWIMIGELPVVVAAGDPDLWVGLKATLFYCYRNVGNRNFVISQKDANIR